MLEHPVMGNGFVFQNTSDGADLEKAFERAFYLFQHKERWEQMVVRGMNSPDIIGVSWESACPKYEDLYQRALQLRRTT